MNKKIRAIALGWFLWSVTNELYKSQKRHEEMAKVLLAQTKINRIVVEDLVEHGLLTRGAREKLNTLGTDLQFEAMTKDL